MRSKSNVLRSKFSIGLDSWFAVLSQRWSCSIVPISSRPIPSSPSGSGLFRTWFQSRSPLDPGPVRSGPDPPGSGLPIPGRPSQGPIRPGPDHVPFDVRTRSRLSRSNQIPVPVRICVISSRLSRSHSVLEFPFKYLFPEIKIFCICRANLCHYELIFVFSINMAENI